MRAPTEALALARAWLRRARNPDGSWGRVPFGPGDVESTLLAAGAGLDAPSGWLLARADEPSARLLPLLLPDAAEARERVLRRLEEECARSLPTVVDFDTSIPAWGWVPGTAAWVIPTAQSLLSLRRWGRGGERVRAGWRFLLDRQGADGGWNYGNPRLFGEPLESFPETTGWALLGLQGAPGVEEAVERGLAFLQGALELPSTLGQALLALASLAHGRDPGPALERLLARQGEAGDWYGRVDTTALAACALSAALEGSCLLLDGEAL